MEYWTCSARRLLLILRSSPNSQRKLRNCQFFADEHSAINVNASATSIFDTEAGMRYGQKFD
jgi:hypothetical protein